MKSGDDEITFLGMRVRIADCIPDDKAAFVNMEAFMQSEAGQKFSSDAMARIVESLSDGLFATTAVSTSSDADCTASIPGMLEKWRAIRTQVAVGVAMSPRFKAALDDTCGRTTQAQAAPALLMSALPVLVDLRMTGKAEVFYDREQWAERCREQREWDAAQSDPASCQCSDPEFFPSLSGYDCGKCGRPIL